MQPDDVNLSYFKLGLFDMTEFTVWNAYTTLGCKNLGIRKSEFVAKTYIVYFLIILEMQGIFVLLKRSLTENEKDFNFAWNLLLFDVKLLLQG